MYEIRHVNDDNINEVKSFLLKVPTITDIDMDVLEKAALLYDGNEIAGAISYEPFHKYALIRYFIFKRNIDLMAIKELFTALEETVTRSSIDYIFSVVNTPDIEELFMNLDFQEIDKENIFLEEEKFSTSKFKNTKMMMKKVITE